MRIVTFLSVIGLLSAATHYYIWARIVRDPAWPDGVRRGLTVLVVVLAILPLATMMISIFADRAAWQPLRVVSMTWMGSLLYVVLFVLVADLLLLVSHLALGFDEDETRRTLFARTAAGAAMVAAAAVSAVGVHRAMRGPEVRRVTLQLARWPAGLSGYRIVQLSDVHIGPLLGRPFTERLVRDVNALDADLVVITGDLVDGHVHVVGPAVAPLRDLRARDGVFFVTGNHEYYSGADEWIAFLATLGIKTLRNQRVALGGGGGFDLAGVDDFRAHEFGGGHGRDLARALAGRDPSRPVVLLAHQPKQAPEAADMGVDLQLSGHTHAGQVRPFDALVRLDQPYLVGEYRRGPLTLYVSPGTGFWGPPMRVGTTSEITAITLEPGAEVAV